MSSSSRGEGKMLTSSSSSVYSSSGVMSESFVSNFAAAGPSLVSTRSNKSLHAQVPRFTTRIRRWWRRLNDKDLFGRRAKLSQLIHAFKMGIYLKVGITLLLLLRLASHSSQMTFPRGAIGRDDHFAALSAVRSAPALRIIVVTTQGNPEGLERLLISLERANYDPQGSIALDIWLYTSSTANALPLVVYPVAVALFGPPRFDHATAGVASSFTWSKGKKSVIAVRSEADWSSTWIATPATANETLLYVDAAKASVISSSFYFWLRRVQLQRVDIAAYSLDSVAVSVLPESDDGESRDLEIDIVRSNSVVTEAFFPGTAAFSPNIDVWTTFLKWYERSHKRWFSRPRIPAQLRVGGYDRWDALRVDPLRAWFTQFCLEYRGRIVHPALSDGKVLVVRHEGTTNPNVARGTGLLQGYGSGKYVHISPKTESMSNLYGETSLIFTLFREDDLVVLKWDGSRAALHSPFGPLADHPSSHRIRSFTSRDTLRQFAARDVLGLQGANHHMEVVDSIVAFGRQSHSTELIFATVFSDVSLQNTMNWLCNVAVIRIAPRGLVLLTRDAVVAKKLDKYLDKFSRVGYIRVRPLILSLAFVLDPRSSHSSETEKNSDILVHDDVLLAVEKTLLIRDVVEKGVNILVFETDQVWFSNPLPYVQNALMSFAFATVGNVKQDNDVSDGRLADLVVSRNAVDEISSSFIYVRASFSTRYFWSEIAGMMYHKFVSRLSAARSEHQRKDLEEFAFNEQVQLNLVLMPSSRWFYRRHLRPKTAFLSRSLFVDSTWYESASVKGTGQNSRSGSTVIPPARMSRNPVVANIHIGHRADEVASWRFVAKEAGHWFLDDPGTCVARSVHQAVARMES